MRLYSSSPVSASSDKQSDNYPHPQTLPSLRLAKALKLVKFILLTGDVNRS